MKVSKNPKKPPSMLALVNRTYRKQLAFEATLNEFRNTLRSISLILEATHLNGAEVTKAMPMLDTILNTCLTDAKHVETIKTLTAHCERLLREKEIALSAVSIEELQERIRQANEFIAEPQANAPDYSITDACDSRRRPSYDEMQAAYNAGAPRIDWKAAGARVKAATAGMDSIVDGSARPENGHDRPPRRPAYELCGFVATHATGVPCRVCEWPG
jgi:hypothetical protein